MVKLVVVDRQGREVEVAARPGFSVMENIRDLDNSVEAICGGMCACATCHVLVDPAWAVRLPPRSFEEQLMLQDLTAFDPERSRLSCQIVVSDALDGLVLTVGPEEY
ncbi:MAG TPA: 2Fe-2S iron-sulfur cluster-binding protein [Gammaproteobacteria bacterium]|nr:2Fe-2S iron-sulfur cluster-binding protein [Gammaproteobacteria bacterium]